MRDPWRWATRAAWLALAAAAAGSIAGCISDIRVRGGVHTDAAVLEQRLKAGQSTAEDVLAALGPPQGKGQALLPMIHSTPRTLWSYYYTDILWRTGEPTADLRGLQLFIFINGDRYDGYLWFSNLPAGQAEKR